jgi:cell division topological specificity factor
MFGFFGKKENSGNIASNRLKVVITQDRASISQDVLSELKVDLLEVFKKYLIIDEEGLECMMKTEEERNVGLSISIPVKKVKKRVNVFDED